LSTAADHHRNPSISRQLFDDGRRFGQRCRLYLTQLFNPISGSQSGERGRRAGFDFGHHQ
jgi:hypothetical protein